MEAQYGKSRALDLAVLAAFPTSLSNGNLAIGGSKIQSGGVHTVALTGGVRAVVKHMAQVSIAGGHTTLLWRTIKWLRSRLVATFSFFRRSPEARPASA